MRTVKDRLRVKFKSELAHEAIAGKPSICSGAAAGQLGFPG